MNWMRGGLLAPSRTCRGTRPAWSPRSRPGAATGTTRGQASPGRCAPRRTAIGRATARPGETVAADTTALAAARQTAAEEARGAGLTRFALLVTATTEPDRLGAVVEAVDQLGRASRLRRLRPCYGSQSASFAAALGIGLVLPAHVTTGGTGG